MRYLIFFCLVLFLAVGCKDEAKSIDQSAIKAEVNQILNDWHNAAAEGDFKRYFSHFATESAIFMGTDVDEYWTVSEFKKYAKKPFQKGAGWVYTPIKRHVYISNSGQVVWFDETLSSETFGVARGTGVLVKVDSTYKIAHYSLSLPIPNSIAYDVAKQAKEVRNK